MQSVFVSPLDDSGRSAKEPARPEKLSVDWQTLEFFDRAIGRLRAEARILFSVEIRGADWIRAPASTHIICDIGFESR
ncbi:hypothetical protein EAH76_23050 [Sphingomonas glacialis]|uniref:Uncharacterized protein n=1 Tax=Sphingomonas glacialis TaxID=658225 RepID=A0A502FAU3_9SPHN|nr:hypothetical protein EAH76_23050 [Sphingomonas glacialis]